MMSNPYFVRTFKGAARNRLFLFPYAGGGASAFHSWQKHFTDTEILPAHYPGRETRIKERPLESLTLLVEELWAGMEPLLRDGTPYYLFGHSLGTKVAYELALLIQQRNLPCQPEGMIIAAGKAPCLKETHPIHQLNDAHFIREIGRFSATPPSILASPQLMGLFLPTLRADFRLDETYHRREIEKVKCPILTLMGEQDPELTLDELLMWRNYTQGDFAVQTVAGAHMFILTNKEAVLRILQDYLGS